MTRSGTGARTRRAARASAWREVVALALLGVASVGSRGAAGGLSPRSLAAARPPAADCVRIEGGRYMPLYRQPVRGPARDSVLRRVVAVEVRPFWLARRSVTNADFLEFVRANAQWRRSRVSRLFADASYLRHWRGDLDPGPLAPATSPVVDVSWFAARAYAAAQGGRLPTLAEWELVAAADETRKDASRDPRFLERLRDWYSRPAARVLPAVGTGFWNAWGVADMHGLVWEWTLDFNSALVSGESRADASLERSLFCGAGASGAADFADYAAFMRFAYRASLGASYTTSQLGFRVAYDRDPAPRRTAVATSLFELDFPLTDASGRRRRLSEFRGCPCVASMIYTRCTSVCPRVTADLQALDRALPRDLRSRTRFLLFSLDPAHDTPAALTAFAREHGLDPARWTLLSASPDDMRTLAAVLDARFRPDAGGEIAHSALVVVVDGAGVIRHRHAGLASDTESLVAAVRAAE